MLVVKLIISLIFALLLSYVTGEAFRAGHKISALMFLAMAILSFINAINYLRALP